MISLTANLPHKFVNINLEKVSQVIKKSRENSFFMKNNYTDITIVLDRSGSMQAIKNDTIGGFNSFLASQKKLPGKATVSLIQFDNIYEIVYVGQSLNKAQELNKDTFIPRGATALLDAIGKTIDLTGKRLASMDENDRPDKVVCVILTDGEENSSTEFKIAQINQMIQHQQEKYAWEFVFLGANQDAIATASQMGIKRDNALSYKATGAKTRLAFASVSEGVARFRSGKESAGFVDEDRASQDE